MTRKDTILVAVVINAGLLAILFTTAVIYDTDFGVDQAEFSLSTPPPVGAPPPLIAPNAFPIYTIADEVDHALGYYASTTSPGGEGTSFSTLPLSLKGEGSEDTRSSFVEVRVKKGDVLEKIARTYKTTVNAIKTLNELQSEHLSIGQVLRVPVQRELPTTHSIALRNGNESGRDIPVETPIKEERQEAVYYTVKAGDNPWKIARQCHVKYEDILRLNHLDGEKARNLQVGERIRVK